MTFSNYHIYVEMVAARDHIIAILAVIVLVVLAALGYLRGFLPKWFPALSWIIVAGGFYASLALWIVYMFSRPAGS